MILSKMVDEQTQVSPLYNNPQEDSSYLRIPRASSNFSASSRSDKKLGSIVKQLPKFLQQTLSNQTSDNSVKIIKDYILKRNSLSS